MYKLLFFNQTLDIGGAETFHTDLLAALQKQDILVSAYVTEPRYLAMLKSQGVLAKKIPVILDLVGNWKGLVKAFFYLPEAILFYWKTVAANKNVDCILLSSFTEKFIVSPIAAHYTIPIVWIEFGPVQPLLKKFWGLPNFLYNKVKNIPRSIIVPSTHTQKDLVNFAHINPSKIKIIPCGRDISATQLSQYKKTAMVKNQVVCVSRLEFGKGQDLLIRAFKIVLKSLPTAQLLITGRSSWLAELTQLTLQLGLQNSVHFVGRVPDSLQLMAESQVCVFPSVWELEGFGLVMIEAMALGKPIVAFKIGPAPEILIDQKNGFLAEKGNIQDLAKQLIIALSNTQKVKKMAVNAKQDFDEKFQIENVAHKYKEVLCQL